MREIRQEFHETGIFSLSQNREEAASEEHRRLRQQQERQRQKVLQITDLPPR